MMFLTHRASLVMSTVGPWGLGTRLELLKGLQSSVGVGPRTTGLIECGCLQS